MSTSFSADAITIPPWVKDYNSFCQWSRSDDFPERGRICYLQGGVWVDVTMEKFKHHQVKGEYAIVLGGLVRTEGSGRYFHDRFGLKHPEAGLAAEPDGMFVTWETLEIGRARLVEDAASDSDWIDLDGTPDMALEVISAGSVQMDTVILFHSYWEAGIAEYWLVDVRGERPRFDIFKHGPDGYVTTRPRGGWLKSGVFGKAFRLTQGKDRARKPEFRLGVQ